MKLLSLFIIICLHQTIQAQVISNAWIKQPIPGMKLTGAYMTIENPTAKEISLLEVSGPDADYYEIHTHESVNGVMKMRQLQQLKIPAGKKVVLKPKSFHIMLIQIKKNRLNIENKNSKMTLRFSNGKKKLIECEVLKQRD